MAEQSREEPERGGATRSAEFEAVDEVRVGERGDQHERPDGAVDGRGVAPEASAPVRARRPTKE